MEPDSSAVSRVERTLWTVWNYITDAVNRLLHPEATSSQSEVQEPPQESADEPLDTHHLADATTEQDEDEESPHATPLLSLSRPCIAWELCTTEINLGPEAGLACIKAKEDEESDDSRQVETSKDEEHDQGVSTNLTDDGEVGAEEALDALSQRLNYATSMTGDDGVSHLVWENKNKDGNQGFTALCDELNVSLRTHGIESDNLNVVGDIDEAEDERDLTMHEELFNKQKVAQDPDVEETPVQTNVDGGKVTEESADASSKERFSDEDQTEFPSEEEDDNKKSPTCSILVQAEQEISIELRSIPQGGGEGRAAAPHSPTCGETREGVPEHNNEPGPDENTTQRFLEGGNCERPLQEEMASREFTVFQRGERHRRVEDTEGRTERWRLGTEQDSVELVMEGSGHPVKKGIEDLKEEETDQLPDGTQEMLLDVGINRTTDVVGMSVFHELAETPGFIKSGLMDQSQEESIISNLQEEVEGRELPVLEREPMEKRQERVEDSEDKAELRTEQETGEPTIEGSGHLVKIVIEDLEEEESQVGAREESEDGTQEMLLDIDMDEGISRTTEAEEDTEATLNILKPDMRVFHESAETPGFIKSGLMDQSQEESRISVQQEEMESRELLVFEGRPMEERRERLEDTEERTGLGTEQERFELGMEVSGHPVKTGIVDLGGEKSQDGTQEMLLHVDMDEGISGTTDAEEDTDDRKILQLETGVFHELIESLGLIKSGVTDQSHEESRSGEEMPDAGMGMEEGDHEVEEQGQNSGSDRDTLLAKPESPGPDETKDQPLEEESKESDEETMRDQEAADESESTKCKPPEQLSSNVISEEILDLWIKTVTLQDVNSIGKEEERPVTEQQEVEPPPVESRKCGLVSDSEMSSADSGLLDLTVSEPSTDYRESCTLVSVQDISESAGLPELSLLQHEDESLEEAAEEGRLDLTEESTPGVQSSLGVEGGHLNLERDESQEDTHEQQSEENGTGSGVNTLFTSMETEDVDLAETELDSEEEKRPAESDSEEMMSHKDIMLMESEDGEADKLFLEEVVDPNWPETEEESTVADLDALDFTAQRWRIAVKNPRARPPTDPRSLLHLPSLDPTPNSRLPVQIPAGVPLGGRGIGIKLPGFGAGFPVLKKTQHVVREEKSSETSPQEPEIKPEERSVASQPHRPKWMPPKHPGFGNPLMSELKTKLKKTPEE